MFICNFEQLYGNRSSHSKMFRKKIISESFWECPKYYLRNNRETSSRSCQPTMTEVWRENSQWIKTIIYFYKIAPPQIFERVLNTPLQCLYQNRVLLRMLFLKYKELFIKAIILQNNKGVSRTQSNLYDGGFFCENS